jgi:hypothetical protein
MTSQIAFTLQGSEVFLMGLSREVEYLKHVGSVSGLYKWFLGCEGLATTVIHSHSHRHDTSQ